MNPLLEQAQSQGIGELSQMRKDPMGYLMKMAQSDPKIASAVNMLKNGQNPQALFYELAKQRGIDPQSFLSIIKGNMR